MLGFKLLSKQAGQSARRVCLGTTVVFGLCWLAVLPAAAKLVIQGAAADTKNFNQKLQDCGKASKSFLDLVNTIREDIINIVTVRLVHKSPAIVDSFGNNEVDLDDLAQLPLKPAGAGDESVTQCQLIAYFLQERYSAWKQADKRLMDSGKTIAWVGLKFREMAIHQDADIGSIVKKLKYQDANNNGTWDFGEPIYEDLDDNGQVNQGDIRVLEGGGFAAGAKRLVTQGDPDVGKKLELQLKGKEQFGYVDDDKDGTWTEGDPIYIESAEKDGGNVEKVNAASFDLAFSKAIEEGNKVRADLGQKVMRVANDSWEEFIYQDRDNSGTVSVNDIRLTARGPYQVGAFLIRMLNAPRTKGIVFVWVVSRIRNQLNVQAGDRDIGRKLLKLMYDDINNNNRHDNIVVNRLQYPEPLYDDRDRNGKVSKGDIRVTGARPSDLLAITVAAGQADVNRGLTKSPFGFEDVGGNKTWDWTLDEEPLYQDTKETNDGKVNPGDRRVMGSWVWQPDLEKRLNIKVAGFTHRKGYEPGSQVQAGHLDVGKPLKGSGRLRYHDLNGNNAWDPGEAIYRKADLRGKAQVEVGDTRISERFLAFWLVLRGEPDDNRPLIPLYFEDLNGNGRWDPREPRYADDDGNMRISVGDERLDRRFIEATLVVNNDPDFNRNLKASPYGYDDVNGSKSWEFSNSVANMNFDDGSSETWYLENGNIIKIVRTP
jgi:hypothetical protein